MDEREFEMRLAASYRRILEAAAKGDSDLSQADALAMGLNEEITWLEIP